MNLNLTSEEKSFILNKYQSKGFSYEKSKDKLIKLIEKINNLKIDKRKKKQYQEIICKEFNKEFAKLYNK
jgi:hypothetical protein